MYHKPTLEVAPGAIPGAVPGVTPEVKAGVVAGLIVGVALGVNDQGPLPDLNLGGRLPLENWRRSRTPREVWRTCCQSPPFWTWRCG